MKEVKTIEIESPTKEVEKLLDDIRNMSVSNEDKETADAALSYYAKKEIPSGYLLHAATITAKNKMRFTVEVLIEKESGGIGR